MVDACTDASDHRCSRNAGARHRPAPQEGAEVSRMNGLILRMEVEEEGAAKHLRLNSINAACARFFARRGIHQPTLQQAIAKKCSRMRDKKRRNRSRNHTA